MKSLFLFCFFFLIGLTVQAQTDSWTAYRNNETELTGFKDANDSVQISPKFMGYTIAEKFDEVIAVMEKNNGQYKTYHLNKLGHMFGRDSLYIFDNSADCESEGFIRFRATSSDNIGMFNSDGTIAIPAEYNALSQVQNGLVRALKGANKKYWEGDTHSGCNHYSWEGGEEYLITTNNEIIIENFQHDGELNLYSYQSQADSGVDPTKRYFKGKDDQILSFIDFEKEFKNWLFSSLLNNLTIEPFISACYSNMTYWKETEGWINEPIKSFLKRNFNLFEERLLLLENKDTDYFISIESLNQFIYTGEEFEMYFDNCGQALLTKYPLLSVIINTKTENDLLQDHFDFLRTDDGYKLISVTIRNGDLK